MDIINTIKINTHLDVFSEIYSSVFVDNEPSNEIQLRDFSDEFSNMPLSDDIEPGSFISNSDHAYF